MLERIKAKVVIKEEQKEGTCLEHNYRQEFVVDKSRKWPRQKNAGSDFGDSECDSETLVNKVSDQKHLLLLLDNLRFPFSFPRCFL